MGEQPPIGADAQARKQASPSQVAAVVCGNALEFYDFLTYAYFAVQIGRAFFPSSDPSSSLLASLATFGAGFLMRPVGAAVIGRLGDRHGRKPAMLISFGLMGVAMAGLALTPSFASIGAAAPVLAVAFRLVQGFALGGEVGPNTAFLTEAAEPQRRGLYISLQIASQRFAALASGAIGLVISSRFPPAALDSWGWRAAFLLGAAIVPFGLILRSSLVETLGGAETAEADEVSPVRPFRLLAGLAIVILAGGTIGSYVIDYLTTYATTTLRMAPQAAFAAPLASGVAGLVFAPLGGRLSDRIGRKPVMLGSWALVLVTVAPMFMLLERLRSAPALILLSAGLTALVSMAIAAVLASLGEGLPMRVRSGALGLIYALAIAVFGGTTQFVVAWLTRLTHDPLAPAWYLTGAVALSLLAMLALPESAPARRAGRSGSLSTARIPA